jgi:hypothetical protein
MLAGEQSNKPLRTFVVMIAQPGLLTTDGHHPLLIEDR